MRPRSSRSPSALPARAGSCSSRPSRAWPARSTPRPSCASAATPSCWPTPSAPRACSDPAAGCSGKSSRQARSRRSRCRRCWVITDLKRRWRPATWSTCGSRISLRATRTRPSALRCSARAWMRCSRSAVRSRTRGGWWRRGRASWSLTASSGGLRLPHKEQTNHTMRAIDVVIGDVHARADALFSLLRAVGVIDGSGRRRCSGRLIQVGDLLDRKADVEANLETAELAADTLDVVLVGNHEWRMLADADGDNAAALAILATQGWPHAAAATDGWLVTHAGVHPEFALELPPAAAECAAEMNGRWAGKGRARDPLFSWVGPPRGGDDARGGIFWMHHDEGPKDHASPWGQIAGHVPQAEPRLLPGPRWAIDIKAPDRLAAVVRREGETRWRAVVAKTRASDRRRRHALAARLSRPRCPAELPVGPGSLPRVRGTRARHARAARTARAPFARGPFARRRWLRGLLPSAPRDIRPAG